MLTSHFNGIGYDHSYLDAPPSPAPRKEIRRSTRAKEITTDTLVSLGTHASWAELEIRHAEPDAVHVLMPREPDRPRFRPDEPGISEYNCLLRMMDGEVIIVHLRFPTALFDAIPARPRRRRWTTPDRDGYLWRRGHSADGCPICTSTESGGGQGQ